MIENTVFTYDKIKEIVKDIYNINVYKIDKLNRGSANIYSLNENKYILKEFQSKYTQQEIEKEIKIINHLKEDNIPVPEYVQTVTGDYSFVYENRVVVMQKFIDGYIVESNTGNFEQTLESAEYLGKIIKSLESIDFELPNTDIREWCSKSTINEGIEKLNKLLDKITQDDDPKIYDDLIDKIQMLKYIKDNFDFGDVDKLTIKNTHGDYNVQQFIYKDGKITAIIDFASACKMPIIWEIIRSYSYIDLEAKDGKINVDNLIQYVKVVNKYVNLNKYDLKFMPYLYLVQLLTSTFGYKQYIFDHTKVGLLDFAIFRTNLCRYLFDNSKNISEALINNIENKKSI